MIFLNIFYLLIKNISIFNISSHFKFFQIFLINVETYLLNYEQFKFALNEVTRR